MKASLPKKSLLALTAIASLVAANVEKVIFLAPSPVPIPQQKPTLSDLNLDTLTPRNYSIRRTLERAFATEERHGLTSWHLLSALNPGQRYEVRVIWSALVRISERKRRVA